MAPWPRAVLLAASLLLAGCADAGGNPGAPGSPSGTWRELPPAPVSPRLGAVTAWTGSEVLFLGGDVGPPCPPNVACDREPDAVRDGAAFDPARGSWRRTADAPLPLAYAPRVVLGDVVVLLTGGQLLSYDASDDAWTTHEPPEGALDAVGLGTDGSRIVIARGERRAGDPPDQLYDLATRAWTPVPEDPLGPAFDRVYVGTPAGLVLTGKELVPDPGVEPTPVRAAVLDPGSLSWTRLPDSEQVGGWRWTWTGRRMVDPTPGGVDGGETNAYGRTYPLGGVLDPATGTWGPLPRAPEPFTGGWPVEAPGGPVTAVEGWLYDDREESWTRLPAPENGPAQPGSAVWAGEVLVVLGGVVHEDDGGASLSAGAWRYDPAPVQNDPGGPGVVQQGDLLGAWELAELRMDDAPVPLPAERATLVVEQGTLGGTSFCNHYGSEYGLRHGALEIHALGSTEMACAPALMDAERAYLAALGAGPHEVRFEGADLVLAGTDVELRFRPLPPVPTRDLVGTRWVLDTLQDGETASSVAGEPPHLLLHADGTFTGSTGCRTFTGTWTSDGDTVRPAGYAVEGECPDDLRRQDGHVVAVLGEGFRVEIEGDRLTVTGRDGQGLVYRHEGPPR
ncbi:MAG TPA: META domain-containing protein [Geodermatophilus sp.]|nr:META domain-containing protein [Geodermatophilus sp.]